MAEMFLPNAANWINAYQAGQEVSMTRKRDAATAEAAGLMASGDYAGAAKALIPYDPKAGLELTREADARATKGKKREALKTFTTDPKAALAQALEVDDPEFYADLKKMDDEAEQARYGQWGGILRAIANEPEDAWDDRIAEQRGNLEALGIKAKDIDGFIAAAPEQRRVLMGVLLGRAKMFDQYMGDRDKAADNRRADQQFTETQRHNRAAETTARGNLGVAQSNASRGWAAHNARVAAGGYGTPGVGGVVPDQDVEID